MYLQLERQPLFRKYFYFGGVQVFCMVSYDIMVSYD